MTARTRSRVSGWTRFEPWTTRDTVAVDTPARFATSYTVVIQAPLFCKRLHWLC